MLVVALRILIPLFRNVGLLVFYPLFAPVVEGFTASIKIYTFTKLDFKRVGLFFDFFLCVSVNNTVFLLAVVIGTDINRLLITAVRTFFSYLHLL